MSGLRLAALYGIVTQRLGFCGPQEKPVKKTLLNYLSGKKISTEKIRKILKDFKGAFPYYKLIAKSNKIKDPFDERVVKAYWIGNRLLEKVRTTDLKKMIIDDFSTPSLFKKKDTKEKAKKIPQGSKPHHSFHVLMVGSVSGKILLTEKLMDLCRIGWGRVIGLNKSQNQIKVKYQPLVFKKAPCLGVLKEKSLIWDKDILPNIKIGDQISFHWNHAIQVLDKRDIENLQRYTKRTLDIFKKL